MRLNPWAASAAASGGTSARPLAAPAAARRPPLERGRRRQHPIGAASTQVQQLEADPLSIEELEAALPSAAADEAMPAAAGEARQAVSGGALSLWAPGGQEQEVPTTLPGALATFFTHPSAAMIVCALAGLVCWRAQLPVQHPAADAAVAGAVAAGWCVQEWVIHAWLLHSPFDWMGRRIHVGHHQRPYFHVSIDDPPIVLAFMAVSLTAFWFGFGGSELAVTASLSYFAMGLLYEYTHFIVHTRYLPHSKLGKAIRMHHMLHHTRNEAYWLAFIVPQVDALFGTAPQPGSVRMSEMAKQGLKASREAAAASSSSAGTSS